MKMSEEKKTKKVNKKRNGFAAFLTGVLRFLIIAAMCAILLSVAANLFIIFSTNSRIKMADEVDGNEYQAILVLGCSVWPSGPSPILQERLDMAYEVYRNTGLKIIVSGDHADDFYNEVKVMKEYLVEKGVPSEKIYMDHAGYSTYDSVYRADDTFSLDSMIIVTQRYHLYRAVYTAERFGIKAAGVASDTHRFEGEFARDMREILSRDKAVIDCIRKEKPAVYGDSVSLDESGDLTNEKQGE